MTIDQQFLILKGCLYDIKLYNTIKLTISKIDFDNELRIVWDYICKCIDETNEVPNDNYITDLNIKQQVIDRLKSIKVNTSIIINNIHKDIYIDKLKESLEECYEILSADKDSLDNVKNILYGALNSIEIKSLDAGHNIRDYLVLDDIDKAICKFNIPLLDNGLKGMFAKRLYTVIAPVNAGKSWFFVHILKECIRQNIPAILYTLEMSLKEYKNRLVRCLININNDERITQAKMDNFYEILDTYMTDPNTIYIKELTTGGDSVEFIEDHLNKLFIKEGFNPLVVIIDYADLFKINKNKDLRHELDFIYKYLRKLAVERNICVWTASQVNRNSFSKKNIKMENVSEDIRKMAISDVVIGINQIDEDEDSKKTSLYIGKNRMGIRNQSAVILTDYYNAQFFVSQLDIKQ